MAVNMQHTDDTILPLIFKVHNNNLKSALQFMKSIFVGEPYLKLSALFRVGP